MAGAAPLSSDFIGTDCNAQKTEAEKGAYEKKLYAPLKVSGLFCHRSCTLKQKKKVGFTVSHNMWDAELKILSSIILCTYSIKTKIVKINGMDNCELAFHNSQNKEQSIFVIG